MCNYDKMDWQQYYIFRINQNLMVFVKDLCEQKITKKLLKNNQHLQELIIVINHNIFHLISIYQLLKDDIPVVLFVLVSILGISKSNDNCKFTVTCEPSDSCKATNSSQPYAAYVTGAGLNKQFAACTYMDNPLCKWSAQVVDCQTDDVGSNCQNSCCISIQQYNICNMQQHMNIFPSQICKCGQTPTPTPTPTLSTGAIVGIACGGLALLVIIGIGIFCFIKKRKQRGERLLGGAQVSSTY